MRFSGLLLHKKLAPGDYNLTIYASTAANKEQCKVKFQAQQNLSVDNAQGISYTLKNSNRSNVIAYVIEKEIVLLPCKLEMPLNR